MNKTDESTNLPLWELGSQNGKYELLTCSERQGGQNGKNTHQNHFLCSMLQFVLASNATSPDMNKTAGRKEAVDFPRSLYLMIWNWWFSWHLAKKSHILLSGVRNWVFSLDLEYPVNILFFAYVENNSKFNENSKKDMMSDWFPQRAFTQYGVPALCGHQHLFIIRQLS